MANENELQHIKKEEETQDLKKMTEDMLNSDLWIMLRCDKTGSYMYHNDREAFILIANYLIQHPDIRKAMFKHVEEQSRMQL